MEIFNLKEMKRGDCKEEHQVKIPKSFGVFENLDDDVDINRSWVTIQENIKIPLKKIYITYHGLKQHMPRFSEGCPKLLNQRK
jgi:hypothetical protein